MIIVFTDDTTLQASHIDFTPDNYIIPDYSHVEYSVEDIARIEDEKGDN